MSLHFTLCNCLLSCRHDFINWRAGFCTPYALNLQGVNYGKSVWRKPLIAGWQLGQRNFVHSARVSLEKARHIRIRCVYRMCTVDQTSLFPTVWRFWGGNWQVGNCFCPSFHPLVERGDITHCTEYLLNYVCPTFVILAAFDYHFSTNIILKGEMHYL